MLLLGGSSRRRCLLQGMMLTHHGGDVTLLRLPVLFKLFHPPVVGLDLLPEYHILYLGGLLVKFHAGHAIEPFHVEISLPPHADAVYDQRRFDVDLPRFLFEVDLPPVRVEAVAERVERQDQVETRTDKCYVHEAFSEALDELGLSLVQWPIPTRRESHLPLSRVLLHQVVTLELLLLVRHHPGHFEEEPRFCRLVVMGVSPRGTKVVWMTVRRR